MKRLSGAQVKMMQELAEAHKYGLSAYWYFPCRQQKTGDLLVEKGLAEKDPAYGAYKVGYRLTQAGRDWLAANTGAGVIDLMAALKKSLDGK